MSLQFLCIANFYWKFMLSRFDTTFYFFEKYLQESDFTKVYLILENCFGCPKILFIFISKFGNGCLEKFEYFFLWIWNNSFFHINVLIKSQSNDNRWNLLQNSPKVLFYYYLFGDWIIFLVLFRIILSCIIYCFISQSHLWIWCVQN